MAPGPRRGHRLACLLQSEKDAFDPGLHEPNGIRGKLASPAKGAGGIMQALWEALHGGKVNRPVPVIWLETFPKKGLFGKVTCSELRWRLALTASATDA